MDDCVNVEIFKSYTPSEYKLINITTNERQSDNEIWSVNRI